MQRSGFSVFAWTIATIAFVAVGLFVVFLYTIPGFKPFGMHGIYIQSKYMTYVGDEINRVFDGRNFIIESNGADIIVRMRTKGYGDEGTVQVFENANGISFNSVERTQVDFLEVFVDTVAYTKISVKEPHGLMSRTARVYINLRQPDNPNPDPELEKYNFILNTGSSSVVFNYDDNVMITNASNIMNIKSLVVHGTGQVTLPSPINGKDTNPFSIDSLTVDSTNASVTCLTKINGPVEITGNTRNINLGEIGRTNEEDMLTVNGDSNYVSVGKVNGTNVEFNSTNGSLKINSDTSLNVKVTGTNVSLTTAQIISLDFNTTSGSINVSKVLSTSDIVMQSGTINLSGVVGNVKINGQDETRGFTGNVTLNYADSSSGGAYIRMYDGNVNIQNVRGLVDIMATSMGNTNVSVSFAQVADGSQIIIYGSREPKSYGLINVTLAKDIKMKLLVEESSEIHNNIDKQVIENKTPVTFGSGDAINLLTLSTQTSVTLNQAI